MWQADPATYGRISLLTGSARCEQAVVRQCRDLLMHAFGDGESAFDAAMNARLVASAEEYYRVMYHGGSRSWNLRNSHMADTLEYLLDRAGPDAKAVVWAHNSRIGDTRARHMGRLLGEHNVGQRSGNG